MDTNHLDLWFASRVFADSCPWWRGIRHFCSCSVCSITVECKVLLVDYSVTILVMENLHRKPYVSFVYMKPN